MADGFWQVGLWQQGSDAPYLHSRFLSVFSVKLLIERPNIALVTRGGAKIDYRRHARACERYNRFSRHLPSPGVSRRSNSAMTGAFLDIRGRPCGARR
jgi:hypothetical protein